MNETAIPSPHQQQFPLPLTSPGSPAATATPADDSPPEDAPRRGPQTPPAPRTEFGVARTACACKECRFYCKVMPGRLIPADLGRLIPPDADPLVWAREHLRATPVGLLVPARKAPGGPCHWLTADGRCAVHADAPFGCAMFSCSQPDAETSHLRDAAHTAILDDQWEGGPYSTLWNALWEEGLRDCDILEDKQTAQRYCDRLRRGAEAKESRARKKRPQHPRGIRPTPSAKLFSRE